MAMRREAGKARNVVETWFISPNLALPVWEPCSACRCGMRPMEDKSRVRGSRAFDYYPLFSGKWNATDRFPFSWVGPQGNIENPDKFGDPGKNEPIFRPCGLRSASRSLRGRSGVPSPADARNRDVRARTRHRRRHPARRRPRNRGLFLRARGAVPGPVARPVDRTHGLWTDVVLWSFAEAQHYSPCSEAADERSRPFECLHGR